MKKRLLSLLAIVMIVTAGCVSADDKSNGKKEKDGDNETITLRLSSGLSTQNGWWEGFFEPWMKIVEERTDGRVTFESYAAQELLSIGEELQALRDGTIDIAAPLWTQYDSQRFPLSEVTMLPLTNSDTLLATKAYAELVKSDRELVDGKTYVEYEFGDKDVVVFPTPTTEQYVISTKDYEFETIDDFKEASLRSPVRVHEMFANETGINTVTMPSTEMFDAINRGAFHGSFFSIADWTGYGMQDVFNYTLEGINLGHYTGMWAMSKEKWDSLPEDIRQIMEEVAYEQIIDGAQLWIDRSEENRAYGEEKGAEFASFDDLDQDVQDHIINGVEQTWFKWIEELEENGHPGKEMAKLWRDLIVEQGGEVPEAIMEIE